MLSKAFAWITNGYFHKHEQDIFKRTSDKASIFEMKIKSFEEAIL